MNSIFEYLDYRDFLRDHYEFRKKQMYFYSYRLMGNKVGMDPSFLAKVMMKSLHISSKVIPRFIELCGLDKREGEYFEVMVHFAKAKTEKQNRLFFETLLSLRQVQTKNLEKYQYEYYQKWHYSAVRSVIGCIDFRGKKYRELGEQLSPPISVKETKEAVRLLEKLDLIRKDEQGIFRLTDTHVGTGRSFSSLAVRQFQRETMRLAGESLERHERDNRDISTVTMAIDRRSLADIKEIISECRAAIQKRVSNIPRADCIYQLNMQLFPLSGLLEKEKTA